MRPLELTLKGFQSYADQQTFDFRDRRLVGIVGPIGAGKSSLLDGIAFALYGRTPRAGKSTKGLINQRQGSAHVELWFQVEGETWQAVRALRRKGQSAHNLYRYAGDEPGSERLEEVTGEKLVTARVSELLGLDFEGFSRSVFLAQNRFADFLEATASQRDVVLKGVFALDRLDRMEEVAKTRRDGLRAELADLERLRGEVEADRSPLKEARAALKKATRTLAEIESHRENARQLEVAAAEALGDGERAQSRLAELSGLAAQLPGRHKTGVLLDRAAAGTKGQAEAEAALADATKGLEAARRHQAQTVKKTGGPAALERVGGRLEQLAALEKRAKDAAAGSKTARAGLERARNDAAKAEKDLASTSEAQTVAAVAVESAAEATAAAEEARHRATHEAGALALREGLVVGEPCPVCEQTVVVPPGAKKAPKADQVDRALDRARRTLGKAQAVNTNAATAHATALARVESTHKAHLAVEQQDKEALSAEKSLAVERQGISDQLEKAVGKEKPSQVLERWLSQLDEADALVELKVAAENATRDHLATEQAARAGIGSELVQLATTVATLAGQLGGEIRPAADAAELSDSLDQLRELWEERSAAAQDEHGASIKRRKEAETAVAGILQQLGLTPGITLADAIKNGGADQARLQERVETLEGRAER
ncbi:MAG: AAA family ATPase, partial [Thermoanaerobaculia bacterium]